MALKLLNEEEKAAALKRIEEKIKKQEQEINKSKQQKSKILSDIKKRQKEDERRKDAHEKIVLGSLLKMVGLDIRNNDEIDVNLIAGILISASEFYKRLKPEEIEEARGRGQSLRKNKK